jgi:cob(I)alamin adenosyltransferase
MKISSFFTRAGDNGFTGILGSGRIPKFDLRIETLGTLDEANAALGLARSTCQAEGTGELILKVQRDIYQLMTEVAAPPENAGHFQKISSADIAWLEQQIEAIQKTIEMPGEFIVPGDSLPAAYLDLSRTIIRRAERRVVELASNNGLGNPELMRFLNRLSSLCYVLELKEISASHQKKPTLAREEDKDVRNLP